MQKNNSIHFIHLHFLVFIAGFTAILGELIVNPSEIIVWHRMLIASILTAFFMLITKRSFKINLKLLLKYSVLVLIIALHWITFFEAIEQSNISLTLAMFSTAAFFTSILEPLLFKRKVIIYEVVLGFVVIAGVSIIFNAEFKYLYGIILGILSAFLSSLFAVMNGKFVQNYNAVTISFYEFISGILFISIFLAFDHEHGFSVSFFNITFGDFIYLLILASICTAYAFIASVYVMKHITPFSVVLTYNLEPVYGIIIAFIIFFVVWLMKLYYPINKLSSFLMIPYLMWLGYAFVLNFYIFILN